MAVAWSEATVALVLMLMRTYTNMFIVKSFKWDYFWALITLVRKSFQPYIFRELMKTTGFRHD